MQHKGVISFWIQELLVRCWHDVPNSDRCCHPDSAVRPPSRQEMSTQTADDPGPCWEHDPDLALTTAPITGADLIVSLLGKKNFVKTEVKGMVTLNPYSEHKTMGTDFFSLIQF